MEQKLVSLHVNNLYVIKCWVLVLLPYHYEGSMIIILAVDKIVWKRLSSVIMLECGSQLLVLHFKDTDCCFVYFFSFLIFQIMYLVSFLIADSFRKKPLAELISQIKLSDMGYFSLWFQMNSTWYTAVAPTALFQLSYWPVTKYPTFLFSKKMKPLVIFYTFLLH